MLLRSSLLLLAALAVSLVSAAPADLAEGAPLRRLLARQAVSTATCNLAAAQMPVGKPPDPFRKFAITS